MVKKILFVCLGNICRSPAAEGVFKQKIKDRDLEKLFLVDSAGTGSWHLGEAPDKRSTEAAARRGYEIGHLVSRQITIIDFEKFDYVLAMDQANLDDLKKLCPDKYKDKLELLLDFGSSKESSVPDPYYGGASGFSRVLGLIEDACDGFLRHLISKHNLS